MLKLMYLLVVALFIAGCGSTTPTAVPIPTPIPGFVTGEEKEAYTSFVKFYSEEVVDCTWDKYMDINVATSLDTNYPGKAIYVGDGIWRFYVRLAEVDTSVEDYDATYEEKIVDWRSLPDRTWENKCERKWHHLMDKDYEPELPEN